MAQINVDRVVDYLLVGGGLACATAAEEIRQRDSSGSIVIVSGDTELPYHRPPLSKEYVRGEISAQGVYGMGGIYVHAAAWYADHHVEVERGVEAVALDTNTRTVLLGNGRLLGYRALLLATGGRARRLKIPGVGLPGIYTLRTLSNADALRAELLVPGVRVVVLGSRFIGLETAASALQRGAHVTIVDPSPRMWVDMMPASVAQYFERQFARRGVILRFGYTPIAFVPGPYGRVSAVRVYPPRGTGPVEDIPCDFVIVGIGIELSTELAAGAGLDLDPRRGLVVNARLQASAPDVYAAGDIITYPDPVTGWMHFEHWDHAIASGKVAAANMTGGQERHRYLPYFFSDQFDLSINMLGYPSADAQVLIRGSMAAHRFTALYVQHRRLRAALMVNDDGEIEALRHLIASRAQVPDDPERLSNPSQPLASLLTRPSSPTGPL